MTDQRLTHDSFSSTGRNMFVVFHTDGGNGGLAGATRHCCSAGGAVHLLTSCWELLLCWRCSAFADTLLGIMGESWTHFDRKWQGAGSRLTHCCARGG